MFGVSVRAQLKAESRKLTNSAIRILLLGSFHQRRRDIIATRPYQNGEGTPVSDVTPKSVPDPDLEIRRGGGNPDPEIRGRSRSRSPNFFFDPSGLSLV